MQIVMEIFTELLAGNRLHQPCHVETKVGQIFVVECVCLTIVTKL